MGFLKTLQKARVDKPLPANSNGTAKSGAQESDILYGPDFKFGVPVPVDDQPRNVVIDHPAKEQTLEAQPAGAAEGHFLRNQGMLPLPSAVAAEKHSQDHQYTTISIESDRINPRLVALTEPSSALCESYRTLRTHVLNAANRDSLKSVVMLSAKSGEGKSLTSLNLSWLLAQTQGVRALLIDADLRKPSIAAYLGIDPGAGLAGVLDGNVSLKDAIFELRPSGLHLLSAGPARFDLAEILAGVSFQMLLREASRLFDIVIIDAPPLCLFNDGAVIANIADGAIMIFKSNLISNREAQKVLELIPKDRLIGSVLNQSEGVLGGSGYGYGYGSGYNHYR